jgi:hypothetical protein
MLKFRFAFLVAAATLIANSTSLSHGNNFQAEEPARSAHLHLLAIQAGSAAPHSNNPADQLPSGDGRDVTLRLCSQCHSVNNFAQKRYSKDKWDSVLDDMTAKGLSASDDDMTTVEKYLTTYMAPDSQSKSSADPSPEPKSN